MDLNITSELFEIVFGLLFFVAVMVAFGSGDV
jgi:hypothetical protein